MYYNLTMLPLALTLSLLTALCAPHCLAGNEAGEFCIFGGQSGKPFGSTAAFKTIVWKSGVAYVGGDDRRPAHQRARLAVLKTMKEARGSRIAVGFGVLSSEMQPALDDYVSGKTDEEDFLRRTGWRKNTAADFALYRPIFELLSANKLKALALGLPAELALKIERSGLGSLGEKERAALPAGISVSRNSRYLETLKLSFSSGTSAAAGGAPGWDAYLDSVSAWNENAGEKIADFINSNPGWAALVFTENERLLYNAALPASVKSRTSDISNVSFRLEDASACPASLPRTQKDRANYIWYVGLSTGAAAQ